MAALEEARARLARARFDYAIVDRSAFARLRTMWFLLKQLLGARGSDDRFAALSGNDESLAFLASRPPEPPAVVSHAGATDTLEVDPYERWLERNAPRPADLARMAQYQQTLPYRPIFSIIVPVFNTPERFLVEAIESVRAQVYPNWELCIADDASTAPHVARVLDWFASIDERIKIVYRSENGHISRASNSALELATGEFIALLDHDDLLSPDALLENVVALNRERGLDMIYSDEDKIDDAGHRANPFFKPDWSPETFLSKMYTCHLGVYRRTIVERIGGFRPGFEGSQDYDFVLRFTELTEKIHHIPSVLYSWRMHADSAAGSTEAKPYAYVAAVAALNEALERRGEPGRVDHVEGYPGLYLPRYEITSPGRVSIVIPTRDLAEKLSCCLASIAALSTWEDREIVIVDNGSVESETMDLFTEWSRRLRERFRVVRVDEPFNYSRLNNAGVRASTGQYILLLNNDTEVITPDWIEAMMEHAQRPAIGAVGAKLLYRDGRVQHAGVVLGLGGAAGHAHYGEPGDTPGYYGALVTLINYSAVTAACLMIRRAVYNEAGGFDEQLAIGYNDVDFCLRIRKAGYRNLFLPHVRLYHDESASRGLDLNTDQWTRNLAEQAVLRERWKIGDAGDPYYNQHLSLKDVSYAIGGPT